MNPTKEIQVISVTKTFMMVLIVLYHSCAMYMNGGWGNFEPAQPSILIGYIAEWLNSFHIYVFTFASGYLYYLSRFEKKSSKKGRIDRRIKRILIPYLLVGLLWVVPVGGGRCTRMEILRTNTE